MSITVASSSGRHACSQRIEAFSRSKTCAPRKQWASRASRFQNPVTVPRRGLNASTVVRFAAHVLGVQAERRASRASNTPSICTARATAARAASNAAPTGRAFRTTWSPSPATPPDRRRGEIERSDAPRLHPSGPGRSFESNSAPPCRLGETTSYRRAASFMSVLRMPCCRLH